jgi:hypothetical protein
MSSTDRGKDPDPAENGSLLISRSAEVRLRMIQGPGEVESSPQVFVCPSCGDDTRLVMVTVGERIRGHKNVPGGSSSEVRGVSLLLQLRRRQVEQLLSEFRDSASPAHEH